MSSRPYHEHLSAIILYVTLCPKYRDTPSVRGVQPPPLIIHTLAYQARPAAVVSVHANSTELFYPSQLRCVDQDLSRYKCVRTALPPLETIKNKTTQTGSEVFCECVLPGEQIQTTTPSHWNIQ